MNAYLTKYLRSALPKKSHSKGLNHPLRLPEASPNAFVSITIPLSSLPYRGHSQRAEPRKPSNKDTRPASDVPVRRYSSTDPSRAAPSRGNDDGSEVAIVLIRFVPVALSRQNCERRPDEDKRCPITNTCDVGRSFGRSVGRSVERTNGRTDGRVSPFDARDVRPAQSPTVIRHGLVSHLAALYARRLHATRVVRPSIRRSDGRRCPSARIARRSVSLSPG